MKVVAKQLREADAKHWTQKRLAGVFGVAQNTVSDWFREKKVRSSVGSDNTSETPPPDARVKINPTAKPVIAARLESGESQEQVAADYGVSQQAISKLPGIA